MEARFFTMELFLLYSQSPNNSWEQVCFIFAETRIARMWLLQYHSGGRYRYTRRL